MNRHRLLAALLVGTLLLPSLACTGTRSGCVTDWVPFVRYDGTHYYNIQLFATEEDRHELSTAIIGPVHGQTKRMLSSIEGCNITERDGDAAYLKAGTNLHTVQGFDSRYLLATVEVRETSSVTPPVFIVSVFEATYREDAKVGRDLFDLTDKMVAAWRMSSPEPSAYEMLRIEDPATLADLARAIEEAPVRYESPPTDGEGSSILFMEIEGGIVVRHAYDESSGYLGPGISLSDAARAILREPE